MTFKRSVLALFFVASLASTVAGETIYFLVGEILIVVRQNDSYVLPLSDRKNDSYVLPLSKKEDIDYARYLISQNHFFTAGDDTIVVANISFGMDGINRNYLDPQFRTWSWHVSEFIQFAEITAEILDGYPSYTEKQFAGYSGPSLTSTIGFHGYTVVRELGPAPLYLSILPDGDKLQFYWTDPGTNYVYTLEGKDSLAGTNWFAIPSASWPQKTNHWTLAQAEATARFYRVRAEVLKE